MSKRPKMAILGLKWPWIFPKILSSDQQQKVVQRSLESSILIYYFVAILAKNGHIGLTNCQFGFGGGYGSNGWIFPKKCRIEHFLPVLTSPASPFQVTHVNRHGKISLYVQKGLFCLWNRQWRNILIFFLVFVSIVE